MIENPNDEQRVARNALVDLLGKLGIDSAADVSFNEMLSEWSRRAMANFGTPDSLLMSEHTLAAFNKAFNGPKDPGKEEP